MNTQTRIVVIGGGTGSFALLQRLKAHFVNITALVAMADDGGSTGVLRDELGVLPPGDVRQCLVALSESPKVRDLFNYRFSEGTLSGHSFGNLFLTALEKLTGNFAEAVETASEVLNVRGKVVPITLDNVRLVLHAANGFRVRGEGKIDVMHFADGDKRPQLSLEPRAQINPDAKAAILDADMIVIAPGDIYTSLGPLLIVDGVAEALAAAKATIVYVCNLVVKPGQTTGFHVSDFASEIERFAGGPVLDHVLYNTAQPPKELFERYARESEYLVEPDGAALRQAHYQAHGAPLIAAMTAARQRGDVLAAHRSLIRHDSEAVAQFLRNL
ncbi:MAG TPA: gluconeogenesis factor YvcK family protein [Candidatus Saccharimonadales bacterium]|jgi:uncharacterized cofD-like protein|nr:gluconeogenesis factor YvcK family protein [Candidatus Saccharimonadales bacterium]